MQGELGDRCDRTGEECGGGAEDRKAVGRSSVWELLEVAAEMVLGHWDLIEPLGLPDVLCRPVAYADCDVMFLQARWLL
jgi:hypothetical protein